MHYAATIAGMAFANAFLGVCHSMADKMDAAFDDPRTGGNARYPLVHEIRDLYLRAYYDGEVPADRVAARTAEGPPDPVELVQP